VTIPQGRVIARARSHAAAALVLVLTVYLLAPSAASAVTIRLVSVDWSPRVIRAGSPGRATATFRIEGAPTRVELTSPDGGAPIGLSANGQEYAVTLDAARLLNEYAVGLGRNFVGFLDMYSGDTRVVRYNVFVNVRDGTMPYVPVMSLASDAQATPHVVNIRYDSPLFSDSLMPGIHRFYQLFPDGYDFVAVVQALDTPENRTYLGVKNDTSGLGLPPFDTTALWGSAGALQGVVRYPIAGLFDMANRGAVHEIGHRWINFLTEPSLTMGVPHWPLSDVALGVMGVSIPPTGQGGSFPFIPVPIGDDKYRLDTAPKTGVFNDLELYLMGLLPSAQVDQHFVFDDQDQFDQVFPGGILEGPVTQLTVANIIAGDGARVPAFPNAPTAFTSATIVLSAGRLLSPDELAFFDCMASHGEAESPVLVSEGFVSGNSRPFFVATGGRATLSTTLGGPAPDPIGVHVGEIVFAPPSGSLVDETVTIENDGCVPLKLKGWTLHDAKGNIFTFGRFTLRGGASVTVHTGIGNDRTRHLYWDRSRQVWGDQHDTATVVGRDDQPIDSCSYTGGGSSITC